ncbi:ROK family protein [Vibrio tapetis]|uniref:Fructokinase n=1 Tax=Vibrio tapetis subsp. tapetis TaxID=1671868 RepID=A0A2N8ZKU4_9VIBR|nr:ROK family protein [Vibrio tapetis]SON52514.1 Fructokinase [Vibrio tapetis subsp. tapetis]
MLIGFDIGGTKIEVCLLDEQGNEVFKHRVATPDNYPKLLTTVADLVQLATDEAGVPCQVGIGLPGAICPQTGLMKNANCTFLNGKDLLADLASQLGQPVSIANDANCFALSEAVDGAGAGAPVVFGAILGTGCGGGIVVNQQIIGGPNALAGEWGHNPLPSHDVAKDGEDRDCYCGRKNCIERFISGSGFALSHQRLFDTEVPPATIIERYQAGDADATLLYQQLLDQMGRSFAAIINILDPDVIVLGGGLSNVDSLYLDLPAATAPYVFSPTPTLNFKKAKYGDSSGIRGAAWLGKTQ